MFDCEQLKHYRAVVREDFSLMLVPKSLGTNTPEGERQPKAEQDFSHTAEKGFQLSGKGARKIRSAAMSLYLTLERKQQLQLKFVTLTFPELPEEKQNLTRQEQDEWLHGIFKHFLDNERKNYKLQKYLWVNERQNGERIEDTRKCRGVLHYHCLFSYVDYVHYWRVNLRWLNLLRREGFTIYSESFLRPRFERTRAVIDEKLRVSDYDFFAKNRDKFYTVALNGQRKSIFLQPVDFSNEPIKDVGKVGAYLAPYLSKEAREQAGEDSKIYAKRWACSRGLVTRVEDIQAAFTDLLPGEITTLPTLIDEETGEVFEGETLKNVNVEQLLTKYQLDQSKKPVSFAIEVDKKSYLLHLFYAPFELWAQIPEMRDFFKQKFNFNF